MGHAGAPCCCGQGFVPFVTLSLTTRPLLWHPRAVQGKDQRFGKGLLDCVRATWREGGISFWRGTIPRVCHMTPLAAIQFAVYEYAKQALVQWREA
jgi:hypothetical protein